MDVNQTQVKQNCPQTKILPVIPVYNHTETIRDVATRCLDYLPNVLIVDDGSREAVSSKVSGLNVALVRHDFNLGKGHAILTAANYAREHNFTHIITLDADGQHFPDDIPVFLSAIEHHPESIILGVRDFTAAAIPGSSRFGRAFGNFWVRLQTGVKIRDIQSGFRAYPVYVLQNLSYLFHTFAFEDEVIVRALWAGVSVNEIPVKVYYPDKNHRISHFRKFTDNLKLTILNTHLTIRSILPWPHTQIRHENHQFYSISHPVMIVKNLLSDRQNPMMLAMSTAIGILLGTLPLIACHTIAIIYAASMMRLNKIMAVAASQFCAPPIVPALCIELGYYLRFGRFLTLKNLSSLADASFNELGYMGIQRLAEWLMGSLVLGPLLAIAAGIAVYVVSLCVQKTLLRSQKSPA